MPILRTITISEQDISSSLALCNVLRIESYLGHRAFEGGGGFRWQP